MDFSKTLIKKRNPFALFLIISFVFSIFFSMTSYTSTQDCDSNEDDLQKRHHALEKYIVTSSDLPGTPNFHLEKHPSDPQDQLLEEILTHFPNINEVLFMRTIDPTQSLKTLLQTPNTLKSLRMGCTNKGICPIGMEALTSLITQKSLLFLRLSSIPDFDSQKISILAKALSQSCHLQSLTLQDQEECCAEGGLFLAKSLHNQNSLTKLNLTYCNLGNTGISGILNALSHN